MISAFLIDSVEVVAVNLKFQKCYKKLVWIQKRFIGQLTHMDAKLEILLNWWTYVINGMIEKLRYEKDPKK